MATTVVSLSIPTAPGADRPVLVSRHSSHLPVRASRRQVSRRCRSASPPVKRREVLARLSECCDNSGKTEIRRTLTELNRLLPIHSRSRSDQLSPTPPSLPHPTSHVYNFTPAHRVTRWPQKVVAQLPDEISVKILSYLSPVDLGRCMRVCKDWHRLVRTPSLWSHVDLRSFRLASRLANGSTDAKDIYCDFIRRVEKFVCFIIDTKVTIRRLSFSFDLLADNWFAVITRLLTYADTTRLVTADLDWRYSSVNPETANSSYGSSFMPSYKDVLYKARRRVRKFLDLLELLSEECQSLVVLIMPFEWYDRAIAYLTKMQGLRSLVLHRYFILQKASLCTVEYVAKLISGLAGMERLALQICHSMHSDTPYYELTSGSLVYLDLSQCTNMLLGSVEAPRLEVIRLPFVDRVKAANDQAPIALKRVCIVDVLAVLPSLKVVNGTTLSNTYSRRIELLQLLGQYCICKSHMKMM